MRLAGQIRMGFFPLAMAEAGRIRGFFEWPDGEFSVIDPCAGCGAALAEITDGSKAVRYGIELDAFRWVKRGGVLVLVIPSPRLGTCADVLAVHFRDKALYRLTEPEAVKYQQIVVFGVRRSQRERSRLKDHEVRQAKQKLHDMARRQESLPILPGQPDRIYRLPPSGLVNWAYRGMPLDEIEDLLPKSGAYRQAARILFAPPAQIRGRPLLPLHGGHTAIVAVSGMLDGIFGSGENRHVTAWNSVKVIDRFEEEEDGVITIRERERWSQGLTLIYSDERTAILTDTKKAS
ncbi:MAG: DUF6094 domain-containing protein [Bryobacteraceae bacterium]